MGHTLCAARIGRILRCKFSTLWQYLTTLRVRASTRAVSAMNWPRMLLALVSWPMLWVLTFRLGSGKLLPMRHVPIKKSVLTALLCSLCIVILWCLLFCVLCIATTCIFLCMLSTWGVLVVIFSSGFMFVVTLTCTLCVVHLSYAELETVCICVE